MAQHITGAGTGTTGTEVIIYPVKSGWQPGSIFSNRTAFLVEYSFWANYTPGGNLISAMGN